MVTQESGQCLYPSEHSLNPGPCRGSLVPESLNLCKPRRTPKPRSKFSTPPMWGECSRRLWIWESIYFSKLCCPPHREAEEPFLKVLWTGTRADCGDGIASTRKGQPRTALLGACGPPPLPFILASTSWSLAPQRCRVEFQWLSVDLSHLSKVKITFRNSRSASAGLGSATAGPTAASRHRVSFLQWPLSPVCPDQQRVTAWLGPLHAHRAFL